MKRTAILMAVALSVIFLASGIAAASEDWDEGVGERKNPVDVGAYVTVAAWEGVMDTARLTAKIDGAEPFPLYTPGLDFELHFFGHGAAIAGFSGGFWHTENEGRSTKTIGTDGKVYETGPLSAKLSNWDIKFDLGAPIAEYKLAVLSMMIGLGYAENKLVFDGDFSALHNHDKDLPRGDSHATLKQRGFEYGISLRADIRDPLKAGEHGAFLAVYGFSMGFRGLWASPWMRNNHKIANLPDVTETMLLARVHFGFGGGAYLSGTDY